MKRRRCEAGFTIIESTLALVVIFGVLIGLLASLRAGTRGVVTGRQRSAALAVANEILEQARGRGYAEVGHDLDSDPTLTPASDPAITMVGTVKTYDGEPLAASSVEAGGSAGSSSNPLYPFSPHRWTVTREATVYTATVYVTVVTPAVGDGDPYKRVTTTVDWTPGQYATAAKSVTLATLLFNVTAPPDPTLVGEAEADSGSFTVTGTLLGVPLAEARIAFPYAYGTVDSGFIRSSKGFSATARSEITLTSGAPTSNCTPVEGLRAECPSLRATSGADNDSGTTPPVDDAVAPAATAGGTVGAGTGLSVFLAGGSASSLSTGRSCWACLALDIGDDDRYPWHSAWASGPSSAAMNFEAGSARGSLLSIASGCATGCALAEADRNNLPGADTMTATAQVSYPSMALATFENGPVGYLGMVIVDPVTVTATATSGQAALQPDITGADVAVRLYDGSGYQTVTVTPGSASPGTDPTTTATFSVNGTTVWARATLHWGPEVTASSVLSGGSMESAEASLTSWLWVDLSLVITQGSNEVANLTMQLDYGKVSSRATYQAPSL